MLLIAQDVLFNLMLELFNINQVPIFSSRWSSDKGLMLRDKEGKVRKALKYFCRKLFFLRDVSIIIHAWSPNKSKLVTLHPWHATVGEEQKYIYIIFRGRKLMFVKILPKYWSNIFRSFIKIEIFDQTIPVFIWQKMTGGNYLAVIS